MPEGNYMKPWTKGNCDRCGIDFQITRTEGRARKPEELCGECASWDRGYKEGVAHGRSESARRVQKRRRTTKENAMTEEHDEIIDPIDQRIADIEKHIENSRGWAVFGNEVDDD